MNRKGSIFRGESAAPPIGVLIMAYGGPDSIEDIPGYLADIRRGRPTPQKVVKDITENYLKIGGSSPLRSISRRQMLAIADHFNPDHFKFYLGMRHWHPWIEETVGQMIRDGIQYSISLALAPHYSNLSVAKYQKKIETGLSLYRGDIHFEHVDDYYDIPELIQAFAGRLQEGLQRWPEGERDSVHVIFSAHSLPKRILKMGDPYEQQLRETAKKIASRVELGEGRWTWCYQSAGRSDEPWLGPQIEEHLPALARRGVTDAVILPIGFVSDHVELLYDIDIQAQAMARELDMRLERPPALNTDPTFIAGLARIIRERAERVPVYDGF